MKHLKGDHDAHVETWDQQLWKDWPPSEDHVAAAALVKAMKAPTAAPEPEHGYVYCQSGDDPENLYWNGNNQWAPLSHASKYTRDEMDAADRVLVGGFWMPLERAEELEQ